MYFQKITLISKINNDNDLVLLKAVPEREVCAEDPVHRTLDDRVVSCQPAGTSDDHDERGEQPRRNGDATNHHTPSVRHMKTSSAALRRFSSLQHYCKKINQNRPAV